MSEKERRSLFKMAGLPEAFGVILLTLGLVLLLAPYLGGIKIGNLDIPQLNPAITNALEILGPIVFATLIFVFLPIWPVHMQPIETAIQKRSQEVPNASVSHTTDDASNSNTLQQVSAPVIDLGDRFEPTDGPESLRPAAVDIVDRVARSIQPYFEVRIRATESLQEEVTVLERVTPRSETENRKLAALKTRLQWLVEQRELFSRAIEVVLSNAKIRDLHKVPFDDRTISEIILGLRDRIFTGVSGEYEWYLSKAGGPLQVTLLISETERRRMFTGMFLQDQNSRTLAQIQEQEGHFPIAWLDSDILFQKAVPAIIIAVLQHTELGSSSDKIASILDWPAWRVLLRSPNR